MKSQRKKAAYSTDTVQQGEEQWGGGIFQGDGTGGKRPGAQDWDCQEMNPAGPWANMNLAGSWCPLN